MTHTQSVFLAHWMSFAVILWILCQYYSIKRKKEKLQIDIDQTYTREDNYGEL